MKLLSIMISIDICFAENNIVLLLNYIYQLQLWLTFRINILHKTHIKCL